MREAIFGAQDGLVSTLAVVSTVSGATNDRYAVLVAGIAVALAGIFSMAAGEYLSSKSQREIALAQIAAERERVADRPAEAQFELAYLLEEEGLPSDDASVVAEVIGRHREVLLNTKVLRQYGVAVEEASGSPLQGAFVMGAAFALGAIAPILPYVLLPVGVALYASVIATGAVLFAIGFFKTRWTQGSPIWSGIEILRATFEATADGTRMVESRDMELRPALKLLGPLVAPFWRIRTKTAQKNFKRLVEAQPR